MDPQKTVAPKNTRNLRFVDGFCERGDEVLGNGEARHVVYWLVIMK